MSEHLASERVIIEAPMSFTGSTKRIWRLTENTTGAAKVGVIFVVGIVLVIAWCAIALWYVAWGIWLVPYRIIRRSSRNRSRAQMQHRETLAALKRRDG